MSAPRPELSPLPVALVPELFKMQSVFEIVQEAKEKEEYAKSVGEKFATSKLAIAMASAAGIH